MLDKNFTAVSAPRECLWIFDLKGIEELYRSYESQSFWPFLSAPTQGIRVTFVRAQHTSYNWNDADLDRLAAYGHCMHTLSDAGLIALVYFNNACAAFVGLKSGCRYSPLAFECLG